MVVFTQSLHRIRSFKGEKCSFISGSEALTIRWQYAASLVTHALLCIGMRRSAGARSGCLCSTTVRRP